MVFKCGCLECCSSSILALPRLRFQSVLQVAISFCKVLICFANFSNAADGMGQRAEGILHNAAGILHGIAEGKGWIAEGSVPRTEGRWQRAEGRGHEDCVDGGQFFEFVLAVTRLNPES